ncbi:MAG TPA: transcriptional repressor [Candidatus Atribacteria bacterium]|nr:transcriptional repressor [bacterium]HOQ67611.1 transcriptional repressor [Candidatus Atribacteria bacterium]
MPRCRRMGPPWWEPRFREAGFRLTMPRQVILEVLSNTEEHLSAEEIYLLIHKVYPNIGLTTVYRTLDLLVDMGLVFKFDFGDKRARYELSQGPASKKHHHHLICTKCGRIIDYTDFIDEERELLQRTEAGLSEKYNFKVTSHLIQFYGLCDECQE